ncbi:hypothetical protein ISN45_At01g021570 [Arabidopsis thaliana x Arabidopsis arenosa]|uniref:Uncharacterized protein n=1 Tax=Arabidopsis thaliana x Arabidopsis arenosa TaxID=1240361 RepID=A0A8T2GIE7_9BRAS|nr:hypothetical protein ISN45_At01g021570 [Arabidopsis thaliana x Arabidopsis arenosa]
MSPTSMYIAWGWKDIIPQLPALIHAFQTSEMNTPKMRRLCKFTALPEAMNNIGDRSDVYSFRIFLGTIITVKVSYETLDRLTARHTSLRCYRGLTSKDVRRVLESLVSELNTPTTPTTTPLLVTPSTSNSTSTLVLRDQFEALSGDLDS